MAMHGYDGRATTTTATVGLEARIFRFCEHPRLGTWLLACALILSSSCLFIGLYMDDVLARYIYSDLPGARTLFRMYGGLFGISDGAASNLWQMEHGYAPWWTYPDFRLLLFRPLSIVSHRIDGALWLEHTPLLHAHSLLWLGLLMLAVTRMYRAIHGTLLGGMAALLFALDHTHGFEVGYIANRHVLIAACFGALTLAQHQHWRSHRKPMAGLWAAALYCLALLTSEASVAVGGYVVAFAACVERGAWTKRLASIAPYLAITALWRTGYVLSDYGSRGSGVYIDPATDPLLFLRALLERSPVLLQAAFSPLPADFLTVSSPVTARMLTLLAMALCGVAAVALMPLLRRDPTARFWCVGMLLTMIPAAATLASNRQLMFTSFGAVALVAQLWHLYAIEWKARALQRLSHALGTGLLFVRLGLSPLMLPFTTCGILFTAPLQHSIEGLADAPAGGDVVVVTAPDEMTVRLAQIQRRIEQKPLPRRYRALSIGNQAVHVTRLDARSLELTYDGGLFNDPFTELFRDRHLPFAVGERIQLTGMSVQVTALTADARPQRVCFVFDAPVDAPRLAFYAWQQGQMRRWSPPAMGATVTLPAAQTRYWPW